MANEQLDKEIDISQLIGKGYGNFWNFKGRYRVVVGSRNSKKSVVALGYRPIMDILENQHNNVLVIRQVDKDNRQSTYANILKWMEKMGVAQLFKVRETTMEIIYKKTGQKIFFRGLNNPTSLTSVTTTQGILSKVYIEEAYEIKNYDDFRKLDGSIRGIVPPGVTLQITLVLNPWSIDTWIYEEFFKGNLEGDYGYLQGHSKMEFIDPEWRGKGFGKGLYLVHNNYKINEWRDPEYDLSMDELHKRAPEIYKVEGLGMFGNARGSTYPEFSDKLVISRGQANTMEYSDYQIGIDTGLSREGKVNKSGEVGSATTMELIGQTSDYKKFVALQEYFWSNQNTNSPKTATKIQEEIVDTLIEWRNLYRPEPVLMKGITWVWVDNADIAFRDGLTLVARQKGLNNVRFEPSTKTPIHNRVGFECRLMAFDDFLFSEACPNLIREIKVSRKGEKGEMRADGNDHAINAHEYAWTPMRTRVVRWKDFKEH